MNKRIVSVLCVLLTLAVCSACTQDPSDKVSAVEMSPAGGTFTDSVEVSLTCATSGAKIYYTTDDSEPGESSTAYSAPFKVTSSLTVKARAFLDSMGPSDVSSVAYTVVNGRWQTVGESGFSDGNANFMSMALYQDTPYISFKDYANDDKATVMKYNGTAWAPVGGKGVSDEPVAGDTKIAFGSDGTPYLAYSVSVAVGESESYFPKVIRFNGSEWESLGDPHSTFPTYELSSPMSFAVHDDKPYIACQNWVEENGLTVGKANVICFSGTEWENVGQADFSGDKGAYEMDLAFDNDGAPCVCFCDMDDLAYADFMKLNTSNDTWELTADEFSDYSIWKLDLEFDGSGTPCVVFMDDYIDYSEKATVMKDDGTGWAVVGDPRFSPAAAGNPLLAFNGDVPYVSFISSFEDVAAEDNYRIAVMKFDGQNWVHVGEEKFADYPCESYSMAIDSSGVVYVGFIYGEDEDSDICVMKYDL